MTNHLLYYLTLSYGEGGGIANPDDMK